MQPITSLQNERVKNAVRLRDRRARDRQRMIVIDGHREIGLALASGVAVETLFVCEELCDESCQPLLDAARDVGSRILPVTQPVMEKLAFGDRTQGLLAVAQTPRRSLGDVAAQLNLDDSATQPLVAVLEGVEKPGNIGAVLRTADAAGVAAVIVANGATDLFNPNAIRASLGAIFTVPVAAAESTTILAWLRKFGFQTLATRVDGSVDYATADYSGRRALILGSEAHGLTDVWQGDDVQAIRLPMLGKVDSLNVSATAAILFYEALRQRRKA
jgi:TrmH family RNA methyltransferase